MIEHQWDNLNFIWHISCFLNDMFKIALLLYLSTASFASTIQTEIASVHLARNETDPHLIFLMKDGVVGKLPIDQIKMLTMLTEGTKKHLIFEIELNDDRIISNVKLIGASASETHNFLLPSLFEYVPTVLPSMVDANVIFRELNPNFRSRAQCYNKAHVWVYEENKKRNINLMKVFLFFTSKYIWDYNFNWWFHVSPYVLVNEGNEITENVIDYTFMNGPTKMHQWTNYFIVPKTECPSVLKYSDYEQHQQESYCYLIKKSMYFWQPQDIDTLERTGFEKTEFIKSEVDAAYWQGF